MGCLDNLIGVSGACSTTAPDSGRYLNELPYISIENAEAIVTEEDESGKSFLENKITFAQNEVLRDVRARLMPQAQLVSAIQNDRIGKYPSVRETIAPVAGKLKGARINVHSGAYLEFYINSITLWLDASETVTVYLYDLLTGEELDSYSITTVADVPTTLQVGKGYATGKQQSRLALVYTSTGNAYRTNVYHNFRYCVTCHKLPKNEYASFQGISLPSADPKIYSNADALDNTNGLVIDYSLSCSVDPFICNIKNLLVDALLFKAGELVLREMKVSNRLNHVVLLKDDDHELLLEYYRNEYQRIMESTLDAINLPSDLCFKNRSRVKYATRIP